MLLRPQLQRANLTLNHGSCYDQVCKMWQCEHHCDLPEFDNDHQSYGPANQYDAVTGHRLWDRWRWESQGEMKPFCNETAENCIADCHCGDGVCEASRGEGVLKPRSRSQPQSQPQLRG